MSQRGGAIVAGEPRDEHEYPGRPAFDFAALKRGLEERDAAARLALYDDGIGR